MCVICYKKAGKKMPSRDKVEKCWRKNPDGAGVMWNQNGRVGFAKGFMTLESLQAYLDRYDDIFDKLEVAIHFRIGTHGGNTPENTHPFIVGGNPRNMGRGVLDEGALVLMHNGILPIKPRRDTISDTAELALRAGEYQDPIRYLQSIDEFIGSGNKVLVFDGTTAHFFGIPFKEGEDGLLYSNLNHEFHYKAPLLTGWDRWDSDRWDSLSWTPVKVDGKEQKQVPEPPRNDTVEPVVDDIDADDDEPPAEYYLKAAENVANFYGVSLSTASQQDLDTFEEEYGADIDFEADRLWRADLASRKHAEAVEAIG